MYQDEDVQKAIMKQVDEFEKNNKSLKTILDKAIKAQTSPLKVIRFGQVLNGQRRDTEFQFNDTRRIMRLIWSLDVGEGVRILDQRDQLIYAYGDCEYIK